MNIIEMLSSCLQEDMLSRAQSKELLHKIADTPQHAEILGALISKRKFQVLQVRSDLKLKDLNTLLGTDEYAFFTRKKPVTGDLTEELKFFLEQVALKHFESLPLLWAQVERHKLRSKQLSALTDTPKLSYSDIEYYSDLIEEISEDPQIVSVPFDDGLYRLSDAILLSNIELFVIKQKWYELLFLMEHSSSGQHFVMFHKSGENKYPCLCSSAMITDWQHKHRWLSFSPFFQHERWSLLISKESVDSLNKTGVFNGLSNNLPTLEQFDSDCMAKANSSYKRCEILRLTVCGNQIQQLYLLYLAQKQMAKQLAQSDYGCAYTIINNPWLLNFYAQLEGNAYVHCGSFGINQGECPTYRGMWLVKEFNRQYSYINFKRYKSMARQKIMTLEKSDA
ncbi:acyl-homoserine-lactone synthase [Vibrio coralliilyticus]|uniref:acyl-homoserine-lactone synthase n=1 Tax=Vibrio coralliilyticus TaxID=190893 RepID=UPI0015602C89|nr:acyl-homoserine-lactone synthase [Vibrio coralliilyticus]NRF14015.1 N-(3-hydroxybutanoyl)-L- homoserine lactone synthase LuxM [Vibrio coralliilyticus]